MSRHVDCTWPGSWLGGAPGRPERAAGRRRFNLDSGTRQAKACAAREGRRTACALLALRRRRVCGLPPVIAPVPIAEARMTVPVKAATRAAVAAEIAGPPKWRRTKIRPHCRSGEHHRARCIYRHRRSYPDACVGRGCIKTCRAERRCEYQSRSVTHDELTP
jgi:hypothetical protein